MNKNLKIAKEDLLRIREIAAEHGTEMTPQEVLDVINNAVNAKIVDEPGLVSAIRRLKGK